MTKNRMRKGMSKEWYKRRKLDMLAIPYSSAKVAHPIPAVGNESQNG